MKFSVLLDGVVIGHSNLDKSDLGMGVVFGAFSPTQEYQLVQPIFQLFADGKHKEYYKERDALNLKLRTDTGDFVAVSCIHIADYSLEIGPDSMELEVHLADTASQKWFS